MWPNKKEVDNKRVVKSKRSGKGFKPRTLTLLRYTRSSNVSFESTVPTITLAGKWMYEAGFRSGQKVEITVKNQQLLLRVTD